jgi:hypothetical protein
MVHGAAPAVCGLFQVPLRHAREVGLTGLLLAHWSDHAEQKLDIGSLSWCALQSVWCISMDSPGFAA